MEEELISGIYKWTNPKGRVYIGQAENLLERKEDYRYLSRINRQPRIYRSVKKYGIKAHIWEIKEYCSIEHLDEKERYWQEFYDVIGPMGMNCVLKEVGEKRRILSEETRKKMSESSLGFRHSEETKKKMGDIHRGKKLSPEHIEAIIKANTGRIHTEEEKRKRSKSQTGKPILEEHRENKRQAALKRNPETRHRGLKMPDHVKEALRLGGLTRVLSEEGRKSISECSKLRGRPVMQYDLEGNFIAEYITVKEASRQVKISPITIRSSCNGIVEEKKFKWKYKYENK